MSDAMEGGPEAEGAETTKAEDIVLLSMVVLVVGSVTETVTLALAMAEADPWKKAVMKPVVQREGEGVRQGQGE